MGEFKATMAPKMEADPVKNFEQLNEGEIIDASEIKGKIDEQIENRIRDIDDLIVDMQKKNDFLDNQKTAKTMTREELESLKERYLPKIKEALKGLDSKENEDLKRRFNKLSAIKEYMEKM